MGISLCLLIPSLSWTVVVSVNSVSNVACQSRLTVHAYRVGFRHDVVFYGFYSAKTSQKPRQTHCLRNAHAADMGKVDFTLTTITQNINKQNWVNELGHR